MRRYAYIRHYPTRRPVFHYYSELDKAVLVTPNLQYSMIKNDYFLSMKWHQGIKTLFPSFYQAKINDFLVDIWRLNFMHDYQHHVTSAFPVTLHMTFH